MIIMSRQLPPSLLSLSLSVPPPPSLSPSLPLPLSLRPSLPPSVPPSLRPSLPLGDSVTESLETSGLGERDSSMEMSFRWPDGPSLPPAQPRRENSTGIKVRASENSFPSNLTDIAHPLDDCLLYMCNVHCVS